MMNRQRHPCSVGRWWFYISDTQYTRATTPSFRTGIIQCWYVTRPHVHLLHIIKLS
jgi:hypothetical protein